MEFLVSVINHYHTNELHLFKDTLDYASKRSVPQYMMAKSAGAVEYTDCFSAEG